MPRAVHGNVTFWIRALLTLAIYALTSLVFQIYAHESENEHVHCGDPGVTCEQGEDVVEGDPPPDPSTRTFKSNGTPTPSTGHSNPTNSASDNCEGSGCINHEESYGNTFESTCASLFQNYENMSVFERWGALPVLESCGKTAAAKSIVLGHIIPYACEAREAMGAETVDDIVSADICARTCDKVKADRVPFGSGICIEVCKDQIKNIISNNCP